MGLEGLEVFANMCYKDDIIFFNNLALRMGLAVTGGSDYHGFEENSAIGRGDGREIVPYAAVEALRGVLEKRSGLGSKRGQCNG